MKTVTIQGIEIPLREMSCVCDSKTSPRGDFVNISVNLTNQCPYECAFCCNPVRNGTDFDFRLFARFIIDVLNQTNIGKVTFTGGEPSLFPKELAFALQFVKAVCGAQTVVCTNGFFIQQNMSDSLEYVDNISLSRHHYKHSLHAKMMTRMISTVVSDEKIKGYLGKSKINFSCNLIEGGIDSEEKIYEYLEWANSLGIQEVAFVGLMPVNEWCKSHFIDPKNFIFNKKVLHYTHWDFPVKNVCECDNYAYVCKNGNVIRFYIRHCLNPCYEKGSIIVFKDNKIQTRY